MTLSVKYRTEWLIIGVMWSAAVVVFKFEPAWALVVFFVAAGITLRVSQNTNILFAIFILSLMTTSFINIPLAGSQLKIPFILNLVPLLFISKRVYFGLIRSWIVIFMTIFILWSLMVTLYNSNNLIKSLQSAMLPVLLFLIALNVAAIILSGRLSLDDVSGLVLFAGICNIILGALQYIGFFVFHANLFNLTEEQWIQVSRSHRMTATFWEGDTYGKYLMVFALLMLPSSLELLKRRARLGFFTVLLAISSSIVNQTRSALAGLTGGLLLFIALGKASVSRKVVLMFLIIFVATAGYTVLSAFQTHANFISRLEALGSIESIKADESGQFRIRTIESTWHDITADTATFLGGKGFVEKSEDFEGVSNIFLYVMRPSGAIGLSFFLLSLVMCLNSCRKYRDQSDYGRLRAQGAFLAMIGMLIASQLAPMFIDPLFWMVLGLGIYFELSSGSFSHMQSFRMS